MTKREHLQIASHQWEHIFKWKGGKVPIKTWIADKNLYKKSRPSLKDKQIMFVNQIYDNINKKLLSWYLINKLANSTPKGRIPEWYKRIKKNSPEKCGTLTKQARTGWYSNILSEFHYKGSRKDLFISSIHNNMDKSNKRVIVFGKSIKKKRKNKARFMSITAWHMILENQLKLIRCSGCTINQNCVKNEKCSFKCSAASNEARAINKAIAKREESTIKFTYKGDNITRIFCETFKTLNLLTMEFQILLTKSTDHDIIWEHMKELHQRVILIRLLDSNARGKQLEFYTDGSLKDRGIQKMEMRAAWLQSAGPNVGESFLCKVQDWLSLSKSEAIAIYTVLLTVPSKTMVKIHTDSQVCIDNFNKVMNKDVHLTVRQQKIKNFTLQTNIIEIIQTKRIRVQLIKVKVHSGDTFNDQVDKLAKAACSTEGLSLSQTSNKIVYAVYTFNGKIMDIAARTFAKVQVKAKTSKKWMQLNRFNKIMEEAKTKEQWKMW